MNDMPIYKWVWNGLHLQEPSIFITDLILGSLCFYIFTKISRNTKFEKKWKMFYLMLGICTILGGIGHLFFYYTGVAGKSISWVFSLTSNLYASLAIINEVKSERNRKQIRVVCFSKSIILIILAIVTQKFLFIAIDAGISFIYFAAYLSYRIAKPWNFWMITGVGCMLPSLVFVIGKIDPHPHFNRIDMGHLFMILAILSFWKGIRDYSKYYTMQ